MQTKTLSIPTFMTAAVMGMVMSAGFLMSVSLAHAEETKVPEGAPKVEQKEGNEARAEYTSKIKELQAHLKEGKIQQKSERDANKVEFQIKKGEAKEEMKIDRAAFAASLEGMSDEERRAAMMRYITDMKKAIDERKAAFATTKDAYKAEYNADKAAFKTEKAVFRTDLKAMSTEDKLAAVLERIAQLTAKAQENDDADIKDKKSEDEDDSIAE